MARRFRRRFGFRRRGRGPSPFAGRISGGRGLEWYLLTHDCCLLPFAPNNFDVNACVPTQGELCFARVVFPSVVDGGILTIERIVGWIDIYGRVFDDLNATTDTSFGLKFMQTGLPGGGFMHPTFDAYFTVRTAVQGLLATPQPWQISDGESPTWMMRKHVPEVGDTVIERADLVGAVTGSITKIAHLDIDVRVKRRIDLGHTDLNFQYCFPVCDTEALTAEDLAVLAARIQSRLHLRMLVRTGPGN